MIDEPLSRGDRASREEKLKPSSYRQRTCDGLLRHQEAGQKEKARVPSKTTGTRLPSRKAAASEYERIVKSRWKSFGDNENRDNMEKQTDIRSYDAQRRETIKTLFTTKYNSTAFHPFF